ncbi:putative defense protein 3 [Dermacentor silvarum]|uniref:putative defense protein 3 n=1 Tax=Dermacentor silvarum TaxID=543639 RepID=UPI00189B1D6E|nr:putative defense protein 3 [Dermacentor silvarum]
MRSLSVVLSCLVAVACLLPAALWALPSGAPVAACYSELPGHGGAEPQASLSPYAIQATPVGGSAIVQLYGSIPFKGVLLTARDAHTGELLHGTFTPDAQTRTLDCPGGNANAITHNSRDYKTQVVVTWTAPAGYSGQVYFSATVVHSFHVYWKGITSDAVFVQ